MVKKLIKWFYFNEEDYIIVKIKSLNTFLVDSPSGQRMTVTPIWDKARFNYFFIIRPLESFKQLIRKENPTYINTVNGHLSYEPLSMYYVKIKDNYGRNNNTD